MDIGRLTSGATPARESGTESDEGEAEIESQADDTASFSEQREVVKRRRCDWQIISHKIAGCHGGLQEEIDRLSETRDEVIENLAKSF